MKLEDAIVSPDGSVLSGRHRPWWKLCRWTRIIITASIVIIVLLIATRVKTTTTATSSNTNTALPGETISQRPNIIPSNPPYVETTTNQDPTLSSPTFVLPPTTSIAPMVEPSILPSTSIDIILAPTTEPSLEPSMDISKVPSAAPSLSPTVLPSHIPTRTKIAPSFLPSIQISEVPSEVPSAVPSSLPTLLPSPFSPIMTSRPTTTSRHPTLLPIKTLTQLSTILSRIPTDLPSSSLETIHPTTTTRPPTTLLPSLYPSDARLSYQPGNFSLNSRSPDGLIRLSNGLAAELLAVSGEPVRLLLRSSSGGGGYNDYSEQKFHIAPDGAAVFENPDTGGWYYVSNAENRTVGTEWFHGGVGALEMDSSGKVVGYQRIANRMRQNCGGGKTPWNSWITCEEIEHGKIYQVDPKGIVSPNETDMGVLGFYESFAYDVYTTDTPRFFVTRDDLHGVITRFTPNERGMECYRQEDDYDRWCTLNYGTKEYLLLLPGGDDSSSGNFIWTMNLSAAEENAALYYSHTEGIDSYQGYLYFTSKKLFRLVILDLKKQTYSYESTKSGSFNAQPDQVARILNGNGDIGDDHDDINKILYFCEDGGISRNGPGIFGRNVDGRYFTILHSDSFPSASETTGLAYSPSGHDMYVSFQKPVGRIYRFYRLDGRPFQGNMLDIKYHHHS